VSPAPAFFIRLEAATRDFLRITKPTLCAAHTRTLQFCRSELGGGLLVANNEGSEVVFFEVSNDELSIAALVF
jgi:hypothetical protein